jgi:hypothetical protein
MSIVRAIGHVHALAIDVLMKVVGENSPYVKLFNSLPGYHQLQIKVDRYFSIGIYVYMHDEDWVLAQAEQK